MRFFNILNQALKAIFVSTLISATFLSSYQPSEAASTCEYIYGSRYTATKQGPTKDGSSVTTVRSNASNTIGEANANEEYPTIQFYSLGKTGFITIKMSADIYLRDGADLTIHEWTFDNKTYPAETANIHISQDGKSWKLAGTATSKNSNGVTEIDIKDSNWLWFRYVTITDTTNFSSYPDNGDGFDVDAISARCSDKPGTAPTPTPPIAPAVYLQGRKYLDQNSNKNLDENSDPLLNNWTIRLYNDKWGLISEVKTGHTGNAGQYRFGPVATGNYYICEALQKDWKQIGLTSNKTGVTNKSGKTDEAAQCWNISAKTNTTYGNLSFGNRPLVDYKTVYICQGNSFDSQKQCKTTWICAPSSDSPNNDGDNESDSNGGIHIPDQDGDNIVMNAWREFWKKYGLD